MSALGVSACAESTPEPIVELEPSTVTIVAGANQTGIVNRPLPQPIQVKVTTSDGEGVAGVAVNWSVEAGEGRVGAATTTTDEQGVAGVSWTLGVTAGSENNRAVGTVDAIEGAMVEFLASASPDAPSALVIVSGNEQSAKAGTAVPEVLVVAALDRFGNSVSGVGLDWRVTLGGGDLTDTTSVTAGDGRASARWTLGTVAGLANNTVTATARGGFSAGVEFVASANPQDATTLGSVRGDQQVAVVGQTLPDSLLVKATDDFGNVVEGVTVIWQVASGGGSVSARNVATNQRGESSVLYTLGTTAGLGTHTVTASFVGQSGQPISFTAAALPDAPASLVLVAGNDQTGVVDTDLGQPIVVGVEDQYGNAVPLVTVQWTVTGGNGGLAVASPDTDPLGTASAVWKLGTVAGVQNNGATATVDGLAGSPVSFVASGDPGPAAIMRLVAGDDQLGPPGSVLPIPYAVSVTDAFDNPVPDTEVTWQIGTGGGSLSDSVTSTDQSGVASTVRTLGPTAGPHTTTATVPNVSGSPVTFLASAVASATIAGTITLDYGTHQASPLFTAQQPRAPAYVPNELIVTYREGSIGAPQIGSAAYVSGAATDAVASRIRSRIASSIVAPGVEVLGISPALHAARLRVRAPAELDQIRATLQTDRAVLRVEPNPLAYSHGMRSPLPAPFAVPGDPLDPWQAWHYQMVDLPRGWDITTGSASVLVAVIDDGIRFDHPWVTPNLTNDGYDFVTDLTPIPLCAGGGTVTLAGDSDGPDSDPTQPADRTYDAVNGCAGALLTSGNHGLHVAGTIGAVGSDGLGVAGVNWNVQLRPVRALGTLGFGSFYDIAQAVLYAAGLPADDGSGGTVQAPSGAALINMSLGGPTPSTTLENALIAATTAGSLVIASAGNTPSVADYPAAYPEAMSVSALGPDRLRAQYSHFGPTVEISAPGGDLFDGGPSFGVTSTTWDYVGGSLNWDQWHGTSMAAPHVAGVAALMLADDPSLSAGTIRSRLTLYAVDEGPAGRDDDYGFGVVNARNSLTQTMAPPRQLYALLVDAGTGAVVQTVSVPGSGMYSFPQVSNGDYHVFAGEDENADQLPGLPGRRWGALGGTGLPTIITITGASVQNASFTVGFPGELEPNDAIPQANLLPLDGYMTGAIGTAVDADVYRVNVPTAGDFTFETTGVGGACGFALEEDTKLTLFDDLGTILDTNDDIDAAGLNFCSQIQQTLPAGTFYLQVEGANQGRYGVTARIGF